MPPQSREYIFCMTTKPKNLQDALQAKDNGNPRNRIFIMGCGRSGTWLLTGIMSTFKDVAVLAEEGPVNKFYAIDAPQPVHIAKRDHQSYLSINLIPSDIKIIFIVRHPFDVLTSHNPTTERKYHIQPQRWNGEMQALHWLTTSQRPGAHIVRYEDLVADPNKQQAIIAEIFGLTIDTPASQYDRAFSPPDVAQQAMHGVRAPDKHSIGRWKKNPADRAHLSQIIPILRPQLDWVGERFDYDVSWP